MEKREQIPPDRPSRAAWDLIVTLILWAYFTIGFVILFSPWYGFAALFSDHREAAFQRLNSRFYRGFFFLIRGLMPGHRWRIDDRVRNLRSAVIVCNHRSYLDPLILMALYDRHTTIVKSRLFDLPVFGRMLRWSGYIPSAYQDRFADLMIRQIESMGAFLDAGGNLFVFPEGTRSRNGRIGRFEKGAFKIARRFRVPVRVISIKNTEKMFPPGRFRFDTRGPNTITVELVGGIDTDVWTSAASLDDIMSRVQMMLVTNNRDTVSL